MIEARRSPQGARALRTAAPTLRHAGGLVAALLLAAGLAGGCARGAETPDDRADDAAADGSEVGGAAAGGGTSAARDEAEPVRLARAALRSAGIPLAPGADGLDATEFEANTAPFIAVDFFTTAPPDSVIAFYDRGLKERTRRRDTSLQPGVVRYEFARDYSGLAVKPWDPQGVDSTAMLARFDRRDMQGVTTEELDHYGKFLARARTHVIVNLPRPEPGGGGS